jgi:hypothetical protein
MSDAMEDTEKIKKDNHELEITKWQLHERVEVLERENKRLWNKYNTIDTS